MANFLPSSTAFTDARICIIDIRNRQYPEVQHPRTVLPTSADAEDEEHLRGGDGTLEV